MANAILCLALVVLVVPLQLLGFSATCTMGSDGPFLTGALVSAPLLVFALGSAMRIKRTLPEQVIACGSATVLALSLFFTRAAWLETLSSGSPCGPDEAAPGAGLDGAGLIILFSYLFLPVLLVAVLLPWRSLGRALPTERHQS